MNYLGHFYLAYPNTDLLVGNLLGDCVKGCGYEYYPDAVAAGIKMHRAIDSFTDQHPISAKCRALLRSVAGKFSGVALDVLYDHVLAKNWSAFSSMPLTDFARDVYRILNNRYTELTMESRIMLGHMQEQNWLVRYATVAGTQQSLSGMASRIAYKSNLGEVMALYETIEEKFDALALRFLDDIVSNIKLSYASL